MGGPALLSAAEASEKTSRLPLSRLHCTRGQSGPNILNLPLELNWDIMDMLPAKDSISFACIDWTFCRSSARVLKRKLGPVFQNLSSLMDLFTRYNWPHDWCYDLIQQSSQYGHSILRDIEVIVAIHQETQQSPCELRNIFEQSVKMQAPILHTCLRFRLHDFAIQYLKRAPEAASDKGVEDMNCMHLAVLFGIPAVVETIGNIIRGMDTSCSKAYFSQKDGFMNTALDYAMKKPKSTILDLLVRAGDNVNRKDKLGITPLMYACFQGRMEIIDCLVGHNANVTDSDEFGMTVLENAIQGQGVLKHEILKRLSPRASQEHLNKALKYANEHARELVQVLVQCRADPQALGLPAQEPSVDLQGPSVCADDERNDDSSYGRSCAHLHRLTYRVEAWCRVGRGAWLIVRLGPPGRCRYALNKAYCAHLASLPDVSDTRLRIPNITRSHDGWSGARKYSYKNVEEFSAVVIAERRDNVGYQRATRLYVKIKWTQIDDEDLHLCPDGYSWIPRSELVRLVGRSVAYTKINEMWITQEARYEEWKKS